MVLVEGNEMWGEGFVWKDYIFYEEKIKVSIYFYNLSVLYFKVILFFNGSFGLLIVSFVYDSVWC